MVTSRSVPQQTAHIFSALAGQNRSALRFSQIGQNHDTSAPQRDRTVQQNTLEKDETQKARRARFWSNCPSGAFRGACAYLYARQPKTRTSTLIEGFIVVGAFSFSCWASRGYGMVSTHAASTLALTRK